MGNHDRQPAFQWANYRRLQLEEAIKQQPKDTNFPIDRNEQFTEEEFNRFLAYPCNYKKYRGQTWGDVLKKDPRYFKWVLLKGMNVRLKTWKVFAMLLTPEERDQAYKRCESQKEHNRKLEEPQKRKADEMRKEQII